ncbi:SWIM zinc finger family protein [Kitasatospora misakiensis]|uniref:SWIM zinc finger family protein n=1 Tax=Kitasatospora misakiensis TaxID=67330 RepID=A0ABW0X7E0_9ACTN
MTPAKGSAKDPGRARTFPPLPPARGSRAPFATSWWGQEWLRALEDSALDHGRLQRGRTYARGGAVGEVTVAPGLLRAHVHGSRPRPYRSSVEVAQLTDSQWNRLLDMIAERAANIAALLDGEMPAGLAEDAAAAGVPLLPGPRDLDPDCSCPDWGYPCKHAAALCYQVARLLDQDPFVLLLIRGRDERQVVDELARRNAARAAADAARPSAAATTGLTAPANTPAKDAFAARADLPPLPALPVAPDHPGRGPALAGMTTSPPGLDLAALELLAADAAQRARRLLLSALDDRHAETTPPVDLTPWQDTVRMAAAHPDTDVLARPATAAGATPARLAAAVSAWHQGGAPALDVLESSWTPPSARLDHVRAALREDWADGTPPRLRAWRNRLTIDGKDAQLRLGQTGLWYPYRKKDGTWWPSGLPDTDPSVVLAALLQG